MLQQNPNIINAIRAGHAALKSGNHAEAEKLFGSVQKVDPKNPEVVFFLGMACFNQGKLAEAFTQFKKTTKLAPKNPGGWNALGAVYYRQNNSAEALKCFRNAVKLDPSLHSAQYHIALILSDQGQYSEAEKFYKRALKSNPNYSEAYNNLGFVYQDTGQFAQASECFKKAYERSNEPSSYSNYLFSLQYNDTLTPEQIFSEHEAWGNQQPVQNDDLKNQAGSRPLKRIGFLSPDFHMHPVAFFFEPLLKELSESDYEIFCYHTKDQKDFVTDKLKGLANAWRDVHALNTHDIIKTLLADELDILIDLGGHTGKNKVVCMAYRCAPIQMTWLGYPDTTGLKTVDYRIVDKWTDPEGEAEKLMVEAPLRVESGFLCYQGDESITPSDSIPFNKNNYITFGSFNNLTKVNPSVIQAWSEILHAVPDSKLLLKCQLFKSKDNHSNILSQFAALGISKNRIVIKNAVKNYEAHMKLYEKVDIALDTFPYNGTTTTCDALWMGVPVVTFTGDRHCNRVGTSILNQVGMEQLVTANKDSYVNKAIELANHPEQIMETKKTLLDSVRTSVLCDSKQYAEEMESLFTQAWNATK